MVCYDCDVDTRALAEDETGEGDGFPAGLVGKCVSQIEPDAHGQIEMFQCG